MPLSARGLRIVRTGPDEVVVKRGVTETRLAFEGAADMLERVAELADGTTTEDQLVEAFAADLQEHVRRLVRSLHVRGLLAEDVGNDPSALFWSTVAPHAPDARSRLANASVLVVGAGPVADALTASLRECGVARVGGRQDVEGGPAAPGGWDLWCAAAAGPPEPALIRAARAALAAGVIFLPVWVDDLVVRVGPLTHPYDTACLRCYLLRVDANDPQREVHRLLRGQNGGGPVGAGFLPPMAGVAGQVAAIEAVKHLTGLPVTACGRAIELSLVPFRAAVHRVLRVPRCPECSGTARQGAPVVAHGSQLAE
jgi:bacteriocin biosynthesis cyclodehydratase domain-containing protein